MRLATLAAIAACFPMSAVAQTCGPTPDVYDMLTNKHGESRVSIGIEPSGIAIEVWANREAGTFTVFATLPNGASCAITSGQSFQEFRPEPNL